MTELKSPIRREFKRRWNPGRPLIVELRALSDGTAILRLWEKGRRFKVEADLETVYMRLAAAAARKG
jgi:hypothetical protein